MTIRITSIRERTIPISRYDCLDAPRPSLTTSLIKVDVADDRGRQVTGLGYASIGRFAQGGLIRDRFAPRLLAADPDSLASGVGGLDPRACWAAMMDGEKAGGHGERCVAVGAIDMAIWDATAKLAEVPLYSLLSARAGTEASGCGYVQVYASGGYPYLTDDPDRLGREFRSFRDLGFTFAKMKIGSADVAMELERFQTACKAFGGRVAIDAMNSYDAHQLVDVVSAFAGHDPLWFEDPCDPLDFETHAALSELSPFPIAAGEALFSLAEARLLHGLGGLDRQRDLLVFDPCHCYGLTHFMEIVAWLCSRGWPRDAFWPHGGSLFGQHVAAGLGLRGAEITPFAFAPFAGLVPGQAVEDGYVNIPDRVGIGFEASAAVLKCFEHF